MTTDPSYLDWKFAVACLRRRHESGEDLTPAELAAIVDDEYVAELHCDTFRRLGDVAADVVAKVGEGRE